VNVPGISRPAPPVFASATFPTPPQGVGYSRIERRGQLLFADQNQNARDERQNSHHDCADADVKERSDSNKDQVDREQQHSDVFRHASFFRQAAWLCTLKLHFAGNAETQIKGVEGMPGCPSFASTRQQFNEPTRRSFVIDLARPE
jgi:hypothetical protein